MSKIRDRILRGEPPTGTAKELVEWLAESVKTWTPQEKARARKALDQTRSGSRMFSDVARTAGDGNFVSDSVAKAGAAAMSRLLDGDLFRLECGREVVLEECHIERSALGWLEGSKEIIRVGVIDALPKRVRGQFAGDHYGVLVKPIPEGDLPMYVFMVSLTCYQTVGFDPDKDCSHLVVCWFGNDIETNLSALIAREIRSVDWDKHAVNFSI